MAKQIDNRAIIAASGVVAIDLFRQTYPDFLALFDVPKFATTLNDELSFVGVSPETASNFSIQNMLRDLERLTLDLLDRGALRQIQTFGITVEAQADIDRMTANVKGIPRGATPGAKPQTAAAAEPEAPASKWANLTQAQLDAMPTRETKTLYQTDTDFRVAFDRLSSVDAEAKASRSETARQKVFIYRTDTNEYFWKFAGAVGTSHWVKEADHRVNLLTPEEANRLLEIFKTQQIPAEAYGVEDGKKVDVAPVARIEAPAAVQTKSEWRLEPFGLTTVTRLRRHPNGVFILRATSGEFVAKIDETRNVVVTVTQAGNARSFTSREAAHQAADLVNPLVLYLCRGDGLDVSK